MKIHAVRGPVFALAVATLAVFLSGSAADVIPSWDRTVPSKAPRGTAPAEWHSAARVARETAAREVPSAGTATADTPTVVLLHGLGRTSGSMRAMERGLRDAGHRVVNLGYPSRDVPIAALVDTVAAALDACCDGGPLHFVTHSLGGILVRGYAERYGSGRVGRVVMLSPPNHGSEVIDRLGDFPVLEWVLGPAAAELGTEAGLPGLLGRPQFELGIITGDASVNPLFSWWIPGPDDGKVSVESARLDGADAFLVVPYTHTFIMQRQEVIEEVLTFLETGAFGS